MPRLLLLILLLTVVFSWEECKFLVIRMWAKLTKQKSSYQKNLEADSLTADLVLVAVIPLNLAYLLLNSSNLPQKLLIVLMEFIFLGLLMKGLEEYSQRRHFTRNYQGADKLVAIVYSLLGLVSPSFRFVSSTVSSTARPGKYLLALALPLAAGVALAVAVRKLGPEQFLAQTDTLIAVAVLALVLNVTIEILEKMFRFYRYNLTVLTRVVLGILVIFLLSN
jgi:hypothetical protein